MLVLGGILALQWCVKEVLMLLFRKVQEREMSWLITMIICVVEAFVSCDLGRLIHDEIEVPKAGKPAKLPSHGTY